jgi:hypothetical protein
MMSLLFSLSCPKRHGLPFRYCPLVSKSVSFQT